MEQKMKKIGLIMNVLMGVSLSFVLSLTGLIASSHFQVRAWLLSFFLSFVLSLLIGFFVPVRKIVLSACKKLNLSERTLAFHCADSFVSDLIYTPPITLLMVTLAFLGAKKGMNEAVSSGVPLESLPQLHFLPMFLHSLVISMIVGFVLIFILQPLFLRIVLPKEMRKK